MRIKKFHIYIADLNPRQGTEPGKIRPVVVVQTDLLNNTHPSTIVCPITSQITKGTHLLRIHLLKNESGLHLDSDILVDQIRSIDNRRFIREIGKLNPAHREKLIENLRVVILQ